MCFVASVGKFHMKLHQPSNLETSRIAQTGNEKSSSIAVRARSDTQLCTEGQSSLMGFIPSLAASKTNESISFPDPRSEAQGLGTIICE